MQDHDSQIYQSNAQGYDAPSLPYVPFDSTPEPTQVQYTSPETEAPVPTVVPVRHSYNPFAETLLQPTPPPQKRQWKLRHTLILLAVILVVIIAVGAAIAYLSRSTPMRTLDTFCSSLQHEDYQTAYNQLAPPLQEEIPEPVLASALAQDKIIGCTHGIATTSGNVVTTTLRLVHNSKGVNNDWVTLAENKDSVWQIADLKQAQ